MSVAKKRENASVRATTRQKVVVKEDARKAEVAKLPARRAVKTEPLKPVKTKLVRDSFTMPEDEYAILGATKKACLKAGIEVKKSQLLRIGLLLLSQTETPALKKLIAELPVLKAGRPKKDRD